MVTPRGEPKFDGNIIQPKVMTRFVVLIVVLSLLAGAGLGGLVFTSLVLNGATVEWPE